MNPSSTGSETARRVEVLFRDEALGLVVVNKPTGVSVHRGWDRERDTMLARTRHQLGVRVDPLHRLDKATSGALCFSTRRESTPELSGPFQAHTARKSYLALVRGEFPDHVDHAWDIRLGRSHQRSAAHSQFWCLAQGAGVSLIRADPLTGRVHQLRRHLKQLAHPVIGDVNYGNGRTNREFRDRLGLRRLALHAAHIELDYEHAQVVVDAPLPLDLEAPLRQLGLWPVDIFTPPSCRESGARRRPGRDAAARR